MTLGPASPTEDVFAWWSPLCRDRLAPNSLYALLYREGPRLFPDEDFADLYADIGRRSVPPRVVAVVMVLQRFEGLSDREAVDRLTFDLRWKYACGGLGVDAPGFVHTVLVDMRARLRKSARPNRIFEAVLGVAREAGLIGRKRVLDSTPLYDAVTTQDTVTLVRSAIRTLLKVAPERLAAQLRAVCKRDDDYVAPGKPVCDWQDAAAREALIDALSRDAEAILGVLSGQSLALEVAQAAQLLSTVVGQDVQAGADGVFRIVQGVAKERILSTVDPEARHGHKTAARSFDGYKGHIAVDPDSEIITATEVTPGNAADGSVACALCPDVFAQALGNGVGFWGRICDGKARRAAFCLRRWSVRNHRVGAEARAGRHRSPGEGAAPVGSGGKVRQGRLRRGPGQKDGALSGGGACGDSAKRRGRRHCELRKML